MRSVANIRTGTQGQLVQAFSAEMNVHDQKLSRCKCHPSFCRQCAVFLALCSDGEFDSPGAFFEWLGAQENVLAIVITGKVATARALYNI